MVTENPNRMTQPSSRGCGRLVYTSEPVYLKGILRLNGADVNRLIYTLEKAERDRVQFNRERDLVLRETAQTAAEQAIVKYELVQRHHAAQEDQNKKKSPALKEQDTTPDEEK